MAQKTTLTPLGVSGQPYSFVAKTASAAGPHNPGHITTLGPWGVSMVLYAFSAKTEAVAPTEGTRRQRQIKSLIRTTRRRRR